MVHRSHFLVMCYYVCVFLSLHRYEYDSVGGARTCELGKLFFHAYVQLCMLIYYIVYATRLDSARVMCRKFPFIQYKAKNNSQGNGLCCVSDANVHLRIGVRYYNGH